MRTAASCACALLLCSSVLCTQMDKVKDEAAVRQLKKLGQGWDVHAFTKSVRDGDTQVVALYLRGGMHPEAMGSQRMSCLGVASYEGHLGVLQLLLQHGADPNFGSYRNKQTALMIAAAKGHVDIARALIEAGCDLDRRSKHTRFTALHHAVHEKHPDMVALLVESGASTRKKNSSGETPLDMVEEKLAEAREEPYIDVEFWTTMKHLLEAPGGS